jgi:acetylornithine/succinyldiaminopimelate/putrescine aminotransferase
VRGAGLLIGAETERAASDLVAACHKAGLVVLSAGASTLRLAPPLVVTEADVDKALSILEEVLS